ncbi:GntR family transcriptional regulator [Allonocardiopsis opalescens]|uniref:GntR family transcriptional regulator n=1 Tax=Allonocardiopsis opalescens TaxID=1144618 RepID=UPI0011B22F73|nr:GntR family transcriptional regulator [Allonocardiopsis opalescens]
MAKYQRVADELRQRVRHGDYQPGDRLPAEASLAQEFRISLPTVRQALSILQLEGVIEKRQGIGNFIKENRRLQRRSRHRYGRARSDGKLLTSHLRHKITFAGRTSVDPHIAELMGIEPGVEVVARRRVLYDKITGKPEEIGASYIPVSIAGGTFLEEPKVVPKALFLCVEDLSGQKYSYARDRWIARSAYPEEAEDLELPMGGQVVHLMHQAQAGDGSILEVSESIWPADRIVIIDDYEVSGDSGEPANPSDI